MKQGRVIQVPRCRMSSCCFLLRHFRREQNWTYSATLSPLWFDPGIQADSGPQISSGKGTRNPLDLPSKVFFLKSLVHAL